MGGQLIKTLTFANYKADIYSTNFPGEFRIIYMDGSGEILEESTLSGVSTYRQRETEIIARLCHLRDETEPLETLHVGDPGEYTHAEASSLPATLSATAS